MHCCFGVIAKLATFARFAVNPGTVVLVLYRLLPGRTTKVNAIILHQKVIKPTEKIRGGKPSSLQALIKFLGVPTTQWRELIQFF